MSFLGRDVALEIFYPSLNDPIAIRQQAPVVPGVVELNDVAGFADNGTINVDVNFDASAVSFTIDDTFFTAFADFNPSSPYDFNGYKLSDPAGFGDIPPIVGVSIRPGATLDVSPFDVYFNDDEIFVNASGVSFGFGDQLILDVAFNDSIAGTPPPQYIKDIARLYEAGLGREAEPEGFNYWIDEYESGRLGFNPADRFQGDPLPQALQQMAGYFLVSEEFTGLANFDFRTNPRAYIELLYENVLDRPGAIGGIDYWTGLLETQQISFEDTLVYFSISPENEAGTPYADDIAVNLTATDWFVV